jgi:hypothetical protein
MKRRVASFGVGATHDLITHFPEFEDRRSLTDFDAFLIDPYELRAPIMRRDFERRQIEIRDLINRKSGIVVCVMRPERHVAVADLGNVSCHDVLDRSAPSSVNFIKTRMRAGEGTQWKLNPSGRGVLDAYFGVLREKLHFGTYLEVSDSEVQAATGKVCAVNSVGYPLCIEFAVGPGRLCFVPKPMNDVPTDRFGAAIVRVIEAHFGGPTDIEVPEWVRSVSVPGSDANDCEIANLQIKKDEIESKICELEQERLELLNHRSLLFGYGRTVLEPVVRKSFQGFGFAVSEEWVGDWDFELEEPVTLRTAIGEVEGSDGPINIDKYRQLLDYFQAEVLEGRSHKGILVGNGYRTKELDAAERQNQFTEHALRGAVQNGFCLLPTTELFKAVCAVLEASAKEKEGLKSKIRESILSKAGVWTFVP